MEEKNLISGSAERRPTQEPHWDALDQRKPPDPLKRLKKRNIEPSASWFTYQRERLRPLAFPGLKGKV